MPRARKLSVCTGIVASIFVFTAFIAGQDAGVHKDLETLYAKRDKAIKDKDLAALRSTETAAFETVTVFPNIAFLGSSIGLKTSAEARAVAEEMLVDVRDVKIFATAIHSVTPGESAKQVVVESTEYGLMVSPSGDPKYWIGYSQDICTVAENGWLIQRHGTGMTGWNSALAEVDYKEMDNSVWDDLKAVYAKRDKAFGNKDLGVLKSLEADDYTQQAWDANNGFVTIDRIKADKENEKTLKGKKALALTTKIWGVRQGKDKNEAVVDAGGVLEQGETMDSVITEDTWVRTANGWKLKSRK